MSRQGVFSLRFTDALRTLVRIRRGLRRPSHHSGTDDSHGHQLFAVSWTASATCRWSQRSRWATPRHWCFSLLGLGALLATSAFWFTVVKLVGGLYLLYLGIKLLRAAVAPVQRSPSDVHQSRWRLFANTYVVTALNPKGIVFFVAFLPQFINAGAPVAPQLWMLAATFVGLATINATLYAVFAASASRLLSSARAQRGFTSPAAPSVGRGHLGASRATPVVTGFSSRSEGSAD